MTSMAAGQLAVVRLRQLTVRVLVALVAQFVIGMFVNLFVTIPDSHPGSQPADYFSGSFQSVVWALGSGLPLLVAHVVLGLILAVGSLLVVVRARALRRRRLTVAAVLGVLFIVAAGFNGASFLDFAHNISSLLMALLALAAVGCYATALMRLGAASPSPGSQIAGPAQ